MAEVILHQYVNSPFSEKIRKIFALKKISWRSVEQPTIMPKPKLIPLTGGYRRIPVMQIGADVWCDSGIILKKIEEMFPAPTIYPDGLEAAADIMNQWADRRMFWSTTPVIFEKLAAVVPKEFIEDRSKMMRGANFAEITLMAPDARTQLRAFLDILDRQLARSTFLLGNSFSLADAACFHPVWFLRAEPTAFSHAQKFKHLMRWFERIDAMGYGDVKPMEPDDALKIARESSPATAVDVQPSDPDTLAAGAMVSVTADDYAFDPVAGRLVVSTIHEVAIEREDRELGKIVNHFPKIGFRLASV
ncbi:MAG: glutathione S-transferase C-terminal domain-containing protein [Candidatus Binatus sp.]|uniref:glutathione S-transferase family protein n=1 Tax=Candidatus Binatus sp. TaxID=2811406 RepID=UPI00272913DB|nr:glutathione S-transferase C-terminal domain-containing protein [Candidatus Binatus sp.]MDO8432350.1 glutathione S-transferase C-terminal domain-containing protein [Candidatus Binatus sp.]